MDEQLVNLQQWVTQRLADVFGGAPLTHDALLACWQPVAGDASLRRYYRVTYAGRNVIVMDSSAALDAAAEFVRVASILQAAEGRAVKDGDYTGVRVPAIYSVDLAQGYLLLEDFDDDMLKHQLNAAAGDSLFGKVLPVLVALAGCPGGDLPRYSVEKLREELDLFDDWYLQRHCKLTMSSNEYSLWQNFCQQLIDSAVEQPQIVVHRDFHSCNLHQLHDGSVGVIDFQDAVIGPITYDLVSWLWDRYIHWPREALERWMVQAKEPLTETAGVEVDPGIWQQYCDWMGLQRNLKIVGIFARLHYRDNKEGYLAMIPQFATYINDVLPRYPQFADIQPVMQRWLSA